MNVFARCAPALVASAEGAKIIKKFNRVGEVLARYEIAHINCAFLLL